MKSYLYDFHIHTCLSPCADDDMTPNNIVNMALLAGLDVIAVTDHNTTGNVRAVVEAGKRSGLLVIPGIELTVSEEFHLVCLFPDCDTAERFDSIIAESTPPLLNNENIFGKLVLMDSEDHVTAQEPRLLSNASSLSVSAAFKLVHKMAGACFPAHIDRPAYGILSSLGFFPEELDFCACELAQDNPIDELIEKRGLPENILILKNSDAHQLSKIGIRETWISLDFLSAKSVIEKLNTPLSEPLI